MFALFRCCLVLCSVVWAQDFSPTFEPARQRASDAPVKELGAVVLKERVPLDSSLSDSAKLVQVGDSIRDIDTTKPARPTDSVKAPIVLLPVWAPSVGTAETVWSEPDNQEVGHTSLWGATWRTILLPGWGHRYMGHARAGTTFLVTDVGLWTGLWASTVLGVLYLQDARDYANRHAGASITKIDEEFLQTLSTYRSRQPHAGRRDSYDEAMLLSGQRIDVRFTADEAHDWDWGTPEIPQNNEHIQRYESILRSWRSTKVVASFALGGLALSRVVAFADVLRIYRRDPHRASMEMAVIPLPDGGVARLAFRF